ncbi:iron ABC transporter permease [Sulfolobaceae archaeon RB850M]|jgi:iron complex transport system permease protein
MNLIKILIIAVLPVSFLLAIIYGEVQIPFTELLHPNHVFSIILYRIRLPTVVTAALVGIILSVSGLIMQNLLRNPLVDPYISGTSSGGAFGAVLTYYLLAFNLPLSSLIYIQPIIAFVFALISTIITVVIGKRDGVYGLVIGGVVISYVFSSITTILVTILEEKYPQIPPLIFWLLGEVSVVGWRPVIVLSLLTAFLLFLSLKMARLIDLVSISDEISYTHKIDPHKFRILWLIIISVVVSYTVSVVGIIGFIGILIPHLVRKGIGGNLNSLILYSSLLGATVMLISNIISHGVLGTILPITPITALMTSPVLISILVKLNASERIEG